MCRCGLCTEDVAGDEYAVLIVENDGPLSGRDGSFGRVEDDIEFVLFWVNCAGDGLMVVSDLDVAFEGLVSFCDAAPYDFVCGELGAVGFFFVSNDERVVFDVYVDDEVGWAAADVETSTLSNGESEEAFVFA